MQVVSAVVQQMGLLNTNSRYLHLVTHESPRTLDLNEALLTYSWQS